MSGHRPRVPGLENSPQWPKFHMRNLGLHLKLKGKLCAASVGLLGVGEREPQPPVENHFTARKKVVWKWKISDTAVLGRAHGTLILQMWTQEQRHKVPCFQPRS